MKNTKKISFILLSTVAIFLFLWVCFEAHTEVKVNIAIIPSIIEYIKKRTFYILLSIIFGIYGLLVRLLFLEFPFDFLIDFLIVENDQVILMQGNRPSLGDASGSGSAENASTRPGGGTGGQNYHPTAPGLVNNPNNRWTQIDRSGRISICEELKRVYPECANNIDTYWALTKKKIERAIASGELPHPPGGRAGKEHLIGAMVLRFILQRHFGGE